MFIETVISYGINSDGTRSTVRVDIYKDSAGLFFAQVETLGVVIESDKFADRTDALADVLTKYDAQVKKN